MEFIRLIVEALTIGLRLFEAARIAGKRELLSEINKELDVMQKLPQDQRLDSARKLSELVRKL